MPCSSENQSSPGLLVTSTCGEEVPQTYTPEFGLVDHASPFDLTTDAAGSFGQAYANEQATSFDETQLAQNTQFGSNLMRQNSIGTRTSPTSQLWSSAVSGSPSRISSSGGHSNYSRMVSPRFESNTAETTLPEGRDWYAILAKEVMVAEDHTRTCLHIRTTTQKKKRAVMPGRGNHSGCQADLHYRHHSATKTALGFQSLA